jgi:hypothetical protein
MKQYGSWYSSIITAAVYALDIILVIAAMHRAMHKKKMAKIRANTSEGQF